MSDFSQKTARSVPVERLLEQILREMEMSGTVFSVPPGFRGGVQRTPVPGGEVETPLGVAAGPYTRMAQNLVSAYLSGARVLELPAPLLCPAQPPGPSDDPSASSEAEADLAPGANSAERVQKSLEEGVKGWFLIQLLARELGLGDPDRVALAAEVRGDVTAPPLRDYLAGLKDASALALWQRCLRAGRTALALANNLDRAYVEGVSPQVCRWVTLAADPLDSAAALKNAQSLLAQGFHVYFKLDPALADPALWAQPLKEFQALAQGAGLQAGLYLALADPAPKLSQPHGPNALGGLPASSPAGSDPGGGRPACPDLTPWGEVLPAGMGAAWSGRVGADNAAPLRELGISPIFVSQVLGLPGGYLRLRQMAKVLAETPQGPGERPRLDQVRGVLGPGPVPPVSHQKLPQKAPMLDCFTAPCQGTCPFHADVDGFLRLVSDGRCRDALRVMVDRNPLPHLTSLLCDAPCAQSCTRLYYDQSVDLPLALSQTLAQEDGACWQELLARLEPLEFLGGRRIAVVGGGPAGMAAAYLIAKRGVPTVLFEKEGVLGGSLRAEALGPQGLPGSLGPRGATREEVLEALELDAQLLEAVNVRVRLGETVDPEAILSQGFSHAVDATGAPGAPGPAEGLPLEAAARGEGLQTEETLGAQRLYRVGRALGGRASLAQVIAQAHAVADGILGPGKPYPHTAGRRGGVMGKKGKVIHKGQGVQEWDRCLGCSTVCETCVDLCPNRANVPVAVLTHGRPWVLHQDALCDGCGACGVYCPYDSAPYKEKFTLYETLEDFDRGENQGFVVLDYLSRKVRVRLDGQVTDASLRHVETGLPGDVQELMETIFIDYPYLLDPARRRDQEQMCLWP